MAGVNGVWWLYMVRCRNNSLYTGIALDVAKRFAQHAAQGALCAKYLRGKAPLALVYQEACGSKSCALQREAAVKKWPKQQKEALIAAAAQTALKIHHNPQ